MVRQPSIKNL